MKAEILKILEMQAEGKLTKDQAAELLAILADQAREKDGATGTHAAPSREAPGPRGETDPRGSAKDRFATTAASTIHGLVDTAIGVGTTVGRVAVDWGNNFLNMVHRDEGGNSVTLSRVETAAGDGFSFRGNSINVSKVGGLTLNQAELCGNNINASRIDHLSVLRGRFTQCDVNGSSVSHITIEGPEAIVLEGHSTDVPATGLRSVIFNASKFSRVRVLASSHIEACTIMASVVRDWELADGTAMTDSRVNDSHLSGLRATKATLKKVSVDRSHVQTLVVRDAKLEAVALTGVKARDVTIAGGTWNDVKVRRDALGSGTGGRESSMDETVFENCTLTGCEFAGCRFRRTTLRNLKLTGVTVRNVDFTGLTLESEEAFRRAAGM